MSTKSNPGKYDCLDKLAYNEPYFVLRAKDPHAPALVRLWAGLRRAEFGNYNKLDEALMTAESMERWFVENNCLTLGERVHSNEVKK